MGARKCHYSDYAMDSTFWEFWFNSQCRQEIYLFPVKYRPCLGSVQHIQSMLCIKRLGQIADRPPACSAKGKVSVAISLLCHMPL